MKLSRREFLQDLAFLSGVAAMPDWARQLDEVSLATPATYPWQWTPPAALGEPNSYVTVLNRIAFGARPGDVERVQKMGIDNYIDEQLAPEKIDDSALEQKISNLYPSLSKSINELVRDYAQASQALQRRAPLLLQRLGELGIKVERPKGPQDVVAELQEATIMRALYSKRQLFEVLADFWSNYFAIFIGDGEVRYYKTVDDRAVVRRHALGNFRDFLVASARSPAMLEYLDNRVNVKGKPNENYAREIMELHTLGVDGGYTQKDVAELARAFTGWTIKLPTRSRLGGVDLSEPIEFLFNARQHDDEPKKILGVDLPKDGGINDALKMIDVLAAHPNTARYLSKRLARRFVADEPPAALVERAAQTFLQTKGDIRATMGTILHSDEFKNSFAQKAKRPFEYIVSAARAVDLQTEDTSNFGATLRALGQGLFMLMTPDGYPDIASAWINSNNLMTRWNIALAVAGNRVPRAKVDLKALAGNFQAKNAGEAVDYWVNAILHVKIPSADREKLLGAVSPGGASATFDANRTPDLIALLLASPQFQYR